MIKSKRGQVILYGAVIGIIVAVIVSIFVDFKKKDFEVIGLSSLSLLNTVKEAESALFFIDRSAKYSLQQAVYDLANNGGISEVEIEEEPDLETGSSDASSNTAADISENTCGKFYGYSIWYNVEKDPSGDYISSCFDASDASMSLINLFNKNLNQYLVLHTDNIYTDNYDYEAKGNIEIIGKAIWPLTFKILKDEKKETIREVLKTSEGLIDFTETDLCPKGKKCQLKKEAYELLLKAEDIAKQKLKKNGIKNVCLEKKVPCLKVTELYRSKQEQIDIWEGKTAMRWAQRIPDTIKRRTKVCFPYGNDAEKRCPHLTGYSVDVVLQGKTIATMTKQEWLVLHQIMTEARISENRWVRYGDEKDFEAGERWHFECCDTIRVARAKELEKKTEKQVTAIV